MFKSLKAAGQAATTAPGASNNILATISQFLPFVLIAVVFYFFIIRPQSKQRQKLKEMISNLKKGDKIITKGGIVGTIWEVSNSTFVIETQDETKMEVLKDAVIALMNDNK